MSDHYQLIEGNLLDSEATFIVHQTNCMSTGGAGGLAKVLFAKFPHADCYTPRAGLCPSLVGQTPGDIQVCGDGRDQRFVINLFGQFHGGGPAHDQREWDNSDNRLQWFHSGLGKIDSLVDKMVNDGGENISVAFPWQIGCGIAGGNWDVYLSWIEQFAHDVSGIGVRTMIYRLPE